MNIKKLQKICHKNAIEKGFWNVKIIYPNERNNGELIALMHSELSEVLEALRRNDWMTVAEEMADTVIRIMDFCEAKKIDLEKEIIKKNKKNKERPYKHNKLF